MLPYPWFPTYMTDHYAGDESHRRDANHKNCDVVIQIQHHSFIRDCRQSVDLADARSRSPRGDMRRNVWSCVAFEGKKQ